MIRVLAFTTALVLVTALIFPLFSIALENAPEAGGAPLYYKDIPGITKGEIEAVEALIAEKDGFTYGHMLETEAFVLPDGTFAGFTIELCKLLSELFGADFIHENYSEWGEMQEALADGGLDFFGGYARASELTEKYYASIPIAGRSPMIYMPEDNMIMSVEDLNGKKIASLDSRFLREAIAEHYPESHFEWVDISGYAEGISLMESGEIDAVIATGEADPNFDSYRSISSRKLFYLAYYPISIITENGDLADLISVIDKYILAGGSERIFELYKKGEFDYKKNSLRLSLTAEELDYLGKMTVRGQKVNIGLQHDAYPASFYNEAEKEFQGVSKDILNEITALTGLEFEPLSTSETTTLADILEKLKNGEISMMTQLLKTESRKNDYIWSDIPYLTTSYALLSKSGYPDVEIYRVPWERVGTVKKSAHEVMFETWFPNHQNRIIYDTTHEAFTALEKGEINLLMLSENMLLQQTNLRQRTEFKINLKFDVTIDSFFGFSKNETILRSVVDKTMGYINIEEIANIWMSKVFDYESEIAKVHSMYLLWFAAVMLAVLVALLFLLIKNKRLGRSLTEYTATLSTIYKSIPDTVFSKNREGLYISCNPSFERQAGLPESEIVGKTYAEVFGDRVADTADFYRDIDKSIIEERKTNTLEEEVTFPDGSLRILEMLKAPLIQNGEVIGIIGMGRDVTERKEIKSRLDSIINTAQIAFILTIDGIITEANRYCEDYIGMKIGDDIRDYYDKQEQRTEILELTDKYGTITNYILYIRMGEGVVHRFLANVTITEYEQRRAHIIWALDIEKNEKSSDLLRETQLSFHTVLDTLPMPVRIIDLESRDIVYVNGSFLELLEYESAEEACRLKQKDIAPKIFGEGNDSSEMEAVLFTETDSPVSVELEYMTGTGKKIEAVLVSRIIDYNGRRSSIGIIKDLTEDKKMAQILIESAEREKEANQAKSLFLASMSHEIRTPMNGIIGMTDLLLNEKLTERQRQYSNDIKSSAESLLNIINDILDLSKITEGKLQITPVDIDLSIMVKNTASMMKFSAQSKGLLFIDAIEINSPEYVRVDDVRLNQILINLLSNAIKFTKNGIVKLAVRIEEGNIAFEISDTGIGIKEEELPMIFAAFEQADKHRNRAIKGTGLGLSITKNLVELMNGKIWVESKYEEGSTFFVTIPYVKGDESAVEIRDTDFEYIFAPSAQILLVDDIQTNLTVGAGLLRLCGITADVAMSGYEAIDYVKQKDYDIVFMDHMMPEMDGIETLYKIRGLGGKYETIPIIALTANAVSESRALLLSSGMDDFLSKPIYKADLMNVLRKWLPEEKIKSVSSVPEAEKEPAYSEFLLAASALEGIDVDLALRRIGGLHDVLEKSIKQIASSIDGQLKTMDDCLAKGDMSRFALDVHGLKGALANIGAMKYSELAAALEIGAKAENIPFCMDKFTIFASELREFADKLKEGIKEAEPVHRPAGEKSYLFERVAKAIDCLDNFESEDALLLLNELIVFSFGDDIDNKLKLVMDALNRYNYDEAILLLKDLSLL